MCATLGRMTLCFPSPRGGRLAGGTLTATWAPTRSASGTTTRGTSTRDCASRYKHEVKLVLVGLIG